MRTSSKTDDPQILALVDRAIDIINSSVNPKSLYRIFDCTVTENSLIIGDTEFFSTRLAQNMSGCNRVVMFGATLGTECDRQIKVASTTDVALAMALQATAADKIEEVCDNLEKEIIKKHNIKLRQRYSPGYFDLDIKEQKKFFSLLELQKRIGLTLTDTYEMLPTKSVTAFIGVDDL